MSFQAYLDNIYTKTGKTAAEFKAMAAEKGLNRHADILSWLKADFGLGTGHARAIADVILHEQDFKLPATDQIAKHFAGGKAQWRTVYDDLLKKVRDFGSGVDISPAASYLSLVRDGKKFAIVQVGADRLDIGVKLKGKPATGRFEEAGTWNNMVTHRVRITEPKQVDAEVIAWLREAHAQAGDR